MPPSTLHVTLPLRSVQPRHRPFNEPNRGQGIRFHSMSCVLRHVQYNRCMSVLGRVCVCVTAGCHRLSAATADPPHLLWVTGIKKIQIQRLIYKTMGTRGREATGTADYGASLRNECNFEINRSMCDFIWHFAQILVLQLSKRL